MTTDNICPECKAELPVDAPDGLCMNCLLQAAIAPKDETTMVMEPQDLEAAGVVEGRPQIGCEFGNYRITGLLGAGGMGTVFDAQELQTGRRIALKVLSNSLSSEDLRQRFLQEGRIAASINHPNSVYVFGTDIVHGYPIITMELVGGGTLKDRVNDEGPLSVTDAVDSTLDLLAGLEVAAEKGILHRDIKPANCFVDSDGTVKIGDFGLSISTLARGDFDPTEPEPAMGTPAFASPEQIRGEDLDVRADIYSVGSTLYYLLTGQATFNETDLNRLLIAVLEKKVESPSVLRKTIPEQLSKVILRCLEKNRGRRYADYDELRQALLPFSSRTQKAANPIIRAIAYWLDTFLTGSVTTAIAFMTSMVSLDKTFGNDQMSNPLLTFLGIILTVLYFGLFDRCNRGSLGKMAFRIHVITEPGPPPSFLRATARAAIFHGVVSLPMVLLSIISTSPTVTTVGSFWYYIGLAVIFSYARRNNGYSGWHDRFTGTRVVSRQNAELTRLKVPDTVDPVNGDKEPDIGPYAILSEIGSDDDSLFLGYDVRLLRKVWIQKKEAGETTVSGAIHKNSRRSNLRWITGKRTDSEAWDVWEAPEGQPLLNIIEDKSWDVTRYWLADLAKEADLAIKNDVMPDVIGLDRIWITHDGHLKMLPFKAPGIHGDVPKVYPIPSRQPGAVNQLLNQIYDLSGMNARPIPLYASSFFRGITETTPVATLASAFKEFTSRPIRLSGASRLIHLLPVLLYCIFNVGLVMLSIALYTPAFMTSPKGIVIARLLRKHESGEHMIQFLESTKSSELIQEMIGNSEDKNDAIETYIAGQFPDGLNTDIHISPLHIPRLMRILNANQNPTPEELAAAKDMLIAKYGMDIFKGTLMMPSNLREIERNWPNVDLSKHIPGLIFLSIHASLAFCGIITLLSAAIFRQGLLFKLSGVAVVNADGREASRLRRAVRALLTFSPFILGCGIAAGITGGNLTILSAILGILLLVSLALACFSVLSGKRSLQDVLAGTYLVIR